MTDECLRSTRALEVVTQALADNTRELLESYTWSPEERRALALARTKLEEASMWALRALESAQERTAITVDP